MTPLALRYATMLFPKKMTIEKLTLGLMCRYLLKVCALSKAQPLPSHSASPAKACAELERHALSVFFFLKSFYFFKFLNEY